MKDTAHIAALPEIERRRDLSVVHFFARKDIPVVLEGCLDNWPLFRALQDKNSEEEKLACVGDAIGNVDVHFAVYDGDAQLGYDKTRKERHGSSYPEFCRRLVETRRNPPKVLYMEGFRGIDRSAVKPHVRPLKYLNSLKFEGTRGPNFWIGSGGQIADLHFDNWRNFICMLEGEKRVTVFPPAASRDLYVAPLDKHFEGSIASRVCLTNWDRESFPRVAQALEMGQQVTLRPGEVLYIPPLWWHHVESRDLNIMANFFEDDIDEKLYGELTVGLLEAIDIFSETSDTMRSAYRAIYRRYAFQQDPSGDFIHDAEPADAVTYLPRKSTLDRIGSNLARTISMARKLPPSWRRSFAEWYDILAFQAFGYPFPGMQPSELRRMCCKFMSVDNSPH